MTHPPQLWLPSLFRIDQKVHGRLAQPVIHEGAGNHADSFLGMFRLSRRYIEKFLDQINPALEALFLAGYKVPWIEFGFQSYPNLTTGVQPSEYWVRVDLMNRQIEIMDRAQTGTPARNMVRLSVQPIRSPTQNFDIDLAPDRIERFIAEQFNTCRGGDDILASDMTGFLHGIFGPPPSGAARMFDPVGSAASVLDYRNALLRKFASDLAAQRTCELELSFNQGAFSSGKDARNAVFAAFRYAIFDTLAWGVGKILNDEIDTHFDVIESADDPVEPGQGTSLPGMLWVFNEAVWETLAPPVPVTGGISNSLGGLRTPAEKAYLYLSLNAFFEHSDRVTPLDSGEILVSDEDPDFVRFKRTGYLDALAVGTTIDLCTDLRLGNDGHSSRPLNRLVDLTIGAASRPEDRNIRKAVRKSPDSKWAEADPHRKVNETLEGLLTDIALTLPTGDDRSVIPSLIDNELYVPMLEYVKLVEVYNPGQVTNARPYAKQAAYSSYLTLILSLFNFNVFSIEQITGDMTADLVEPGVVATTEGEGASQKIRLRHTLYDLPGLTLQLVNGFGDGKTIQSSVAWEYVPAIDIPEDPNVQALLAAAGVLPDDNLDRMLIVAGPGVHITETGGWPQHVPVEIYRVQDIALVPDIGERIDTRMLESSYPIACPHVPLTR